MRRTLTRHPASPCDAVERIEAEVTRAGARRLTLEFVVTGRIADLALAPATTPARVDGLWQHTCFEAFIGLDAAYCEINLAPSGEWAAYRFDAYREGMRALEGIAAPRIAQERQDGRYVLRAALDGLADAPWHLGLSAVIEETSGRKSYWALAHPPGRPDFHHPDCFALELPAA